MLDGDGKLIDGRNRLRACEQAGVAPDFMSINGDDPVALVVSLNVKRRNLTQSQRAIAAAEACQISDKSARKAADLFAVNHDYVAKARALDADLAAQVKTGTRSLADAYDEHQDRKRAATMREQSLDALRQSAPDLADLVQQESLV